MKPASQLIAEIEFDTSKDEIAEHAWATSALNALTDRELLNAAAELIAVPKQSLASSFILHAQLELSARALLLSQVSQSARDAARKQIANLARRYLNLGDSAQAGAYELGDIDHGLATLVASINASNPDAADRAIRDLATRIDVRSLVRNLSAVVAPSLAAAAHAPILLSQLERLTSIIENPLNLLSAPVRFLAHYPELRIRWIEAAPTTNHLSNPRSMLDDFGRHLCQPTRSKSASSSIAPIVAAIDADPAFARCRELIANVAANVSPRDATSCLYRIAAHSMLQDEPKAAPYGWTHSLTIAQGILGMASQAGDWRRSFACAATHTLAARAHHSVRAIDLAWEPRATSEPITALNHASPDDAAAIAFHTANREMQALRTALADHAAAHRDAHLVKYTLACFDAADEFPEHAALFLASAAYLAAWWRKHDATRENSKSI